MPASVAGGPRTATASFDYVVTRSFRGRCCYRLKLWIGGCGDGSSDGSWLLLSYRSSYCWRYCQAPPWPTMEGRERPGGGGLIQLRLHLYVDDCTLLVWQFLGQPLTNTDERRIKAMSAELFFSQPFFQQRTAQFSLSMNGIMLQFVSAIIFQTLHQQEILRTKLSNKLLFWLITLCTLPHTQNKIDSLQNPKLLSFFPNHDKTTN